MSNVSKYQTKKESGSDQRKRAKKGVNPVSLPVGVLCVGLSIPFVLLFKRRFSLSEGGILLLLSVICYPSVSVSKLMLLHYGCKSGCHERSIQRRLCTLERKGLVERVGIHWSVSSMALSAIREIDAGIGQSGVK